MTLETERLLLRPFAPEDFEAVHAYAGNPGNVRYMIWGPNDEAATKHFIADCMEKQAETPRQQYDFAVQLKTGGLIGGCGLYLGKAHAGGMIGYILHRDHWNRGYGTELARALVSLGFERLELHKVWACCFAENTGSYRVMEKAGMRREGLLRQSRLCRGQYIDEYYYGVLREEWCDGAARRNGS